MIVINLHMQYDIHLLIYVLCYIFQDVERSHLNVSFLVEVNVGNFVCGYKNYNKHNILKY